MNVLRRAIIGRVLVCALALFVAGAALPSSASAHIANEKTLFPDIAGFDARFDIVLLVSAGIIPQTPVFEPARELTREDLAAWAALTHRAAEGGETPDVDALAQAALDAGLVDSLEGNASLADINRALFEGAIPVDNQDQVPTRAEAVSWIADHLDDPIGDTTLLAELGMRPGPTGEVVSVESREVDQNGETANRYFLTIGGTTLRMYHHGRVGNGPTDLLQWEGLNVVRSLVTEDPEHGGEPMLTFVQAGDEETGAQTEPDGEGGSLTGRLGQGPDAGAGDDDGGTTPYLLYGVAVAVVILGVALFGRRRPGR